MTMTIDQVENAWLAGSTDWDNFIEKFEVDFMAPVELRMQRIVWNTMTDEQKMLFSMVNPEAYAEIEQQMKLQEV